MWGATELSIEDDGLMQGFRKLLHDTMQDTTFDCGHPEFLSSSQLQQLYCTDGDGKESALFAEVQVDAGLLTSLATELCQVLRHDVISGSNTIVNRPAFLMGGGVPWIEAPELARNLIRAAAILGTDRVMELVFAWVERKPFQYHRHALLDGVATEQTLNLDQGVSVTTLPASLKELPAHVPHYARVLVGDQDFLGSCKVSVTHEAVLPAKLSKDNYRTFKPALPSIGIPDFEFGAFCEALSLASNHYVSLIAEWVDYGDWLVLNSGGWLGSIRHIAPYFDKADISLEQLENALKLYATRHARGAQGHVDIAISRWIRSKISSASTTDRFIDLRVALEALYLQEMNDELGFRLATYGAWDLGTSFEKRKEYREILHAVYARASKAIHANTKAFTKKDREQLANAQDLCRRGILKRLEESEMPDWNDLILGKEV